MPGVSVICSMKFFPASDSLQRTVDCETGCFHYQGTIILDFSPSGFFSRDSEGKNPDSTVAIFFRGSRALGRKHRAVLDFRGRDRWLINGNQSIDVTFFLPGLYFKEAQ